MTITKKYEPSRKKKPLNNLHIGHDPFLVVLVQRNCTSLGQLFRWSQPELSTKARHALAKLGTDSTGSGRRCRSHGREIEEGYTPRDVQIGK